MKKETISFFANVFGAKGKSSSQETSVRITSYSQPHVLRHRMTEEKMTHGETVTANISPVRLERTFHNDAVLYFCPLQKIEIVNKLSEGDGGRLPEQAILEGFSVPHDYSPGLYKVCDVEITSNGTMQVKATTNTKWEKIAD